MLAEMAGGRRALKDPVTALGREVQVPLSTEVTSQMTGFVS